MAKSVVGIGLIGAAAWAYMQTRGPKVPIDLVANLVDVPKEPQSTVGFYLSGHGKSGEAVTIERGGKVIAKGVVAKNGRWLVKPKIGPGIYKFTAKVGVESEDFKAFVYSPSRPTLTAESDLKETILSGITAPDHKIAIFRNGNTLAKAEATATGEWTYTVKSKPGTSIYTARGALEGSYSSVVVNVGRPSKVAPKVFVKVPVGDSGLMLVRGFATPSGKVVLWNGAKRVGTSVANPRGEWAIRYQGTMVGTQFKVYTAK
ncbi:MAG: hypothetical protein K8R88_09905 [Armatimonadetes bacterium]|nr:hypothetical protein [Armatimonadota bacterium]